MVKKKPVIQLNIQTFLVLVTVVASCTMLTKGFMQQPTINICDKRVAEIQESIEYENRRIEEINGIMEKVGTDEYIEKIAREKLGMIKADEIVFVDISGQ